MKLLILLLVLGVGLGFSQQPTFILAGKMMCAARLNDPKHLQVWCSVGPDVRFNCVNKAPSNVDSVQAVGYIVSYGDPADSVTGEEAASITWSFFVSLTDQTKIGYSVSYSHGDVVSKLFTGVLN